MSRRRTRVSRFPLLILLLGLSCGAGSGDLEVPPDESLPLDEYPQLGIPPVGRGWSADQRATARSILRALADGRPTHLPRFASKRSGVLFEKLIHEEVFRRDALEGEVGAMTGHEFDELTPDELAQTLFRDSLEAIYDLRSTGVLFDRELVELAAQQFAKALQFRTDFDSSLAKVEAELPSSTRGDDLVARYREMLDAIDRVLVQRLSQLAAFAVAERFTPTAEADATSHLAHVVPRIAPLLSTEARADLHEALREVSATPGADPRLMPLSDPW